MVVHAHVHTLKTYFVSCRGSQNLSRLRWWTVLQHSQIQTTQLSHSFVQSVEVVVVIL